MLGVFIFVYCIAQVLAASSASTTTTETKHPENQFTITVTNIGAEAKPSIIILETTKQNKPSKQDKTPLEDEYIEFEDPELMGDELDFLGAENEPFDESMSFEEEESVSSSSIQEGNVINLVSVLMLYV